MKSVKVGQKELASLRSSRAGHLYCLRLLAHVPAQITRRIERRLAKKSLAYIEGRTRA